MDKKDLMIALDEFEDRRSYYLDDKFRLKCYDLAIKALEKQIPIEPKWEGESMGIKNLNFDNMYCPICDYVFKEDYNYCPDCGQKLLWH